MMKEIVTSNCSVFGGILFLSHNHLPLPPYPFPPPPNSYPLSGGVLKQINYTVMRRIKECSNFEVMKSNFYYLITGNLEH